MDIAENRTLAGIFRDFAAHHPEVAERIRIVLKHVPAERLSVSPDCGFFQLPRWVCRRKLNNLVAGARLVRQELEGRT